MDKPAARIGDSHSCPMVTPGGVPHKGGKIISGCKTVWIENELAAIVGNVCLCNGGFLDVITSGSPGVFIEGKSAARQSDLCAHGGKITSGSATVFIGGLSKEEKIIIINQAIQDCIVLLERKLGLLEQGDTDTLVEFKKWFGKDDKEAKQTIFTRIERALEVSRTLTVDNFIDRSVEQKRETIFAEVYHLDKLYRIFVNHLFWEAESTGKNSRAGVIAHELSHFNDIGKTVDCVHKTLCLVLAKVRPKDAIKNADNFQGFIES